MASRGMGRNIRVAPAFSYDSSEESGNPRGRVTHYRWTCFRHFAEAQVKSTNPVMTSSRHCPRAVRGVGLLACARAGGAGRPPEIARVRNRRTRLDVAWEVINYPGRFKKAAWNRQA
jgi:hypothetical protein